MMRFFSLIAGMLLALASVPASADQFPDRPLFMGYYESWADIPVATGSVTQLANLPASLDIVALGFAKPNLKFPGTDLKGTGLQVPFDGDVLTQAIAALRARAPGIKLLLAIGGSGYNTLWGQYDPDAAARLVAALGLDGVDLDYEPPAPQCARHHNDDDRVSVTCATDAVWADIIRRTRAALPRPAVLALPAWSVGAYGAGNFQNDPPSSAFTGSMLWLGRAPEAKLVDLVSIMAYEAGPAFDPMRSVMAYRAIWPGRLLLGALVPPDHTGGVTYSVATLQRLTAAVASDAKGGMMLYALQSEPPGGASLAAPDGRLSARTICQALHRPNC
jgi:hypothetical protein